MSVSEARAHPTGIVTFLFTDVEGSTTLARSLGERWIDVVGEHDRRLRDAIEAAGGIVVRTEGDSFFAAFATPEAAVRAAVDIQHAVAAPLPSGVALRVRIGVHTGPGVVVGGDYVGYEVHRAARVAAAGHGGQVLVSDATRVLLEQALPGGVVLRDLGTYRLKDVGPQRLHQLVIDGLPSEFPAPRSLEPETRLPAQLTEFVGRERELRQVRDLLGGVRLLTLTGPGGTGKTRLAVEGARRVRDRFEAVYFVDLAPVTNPDEVGARIAAVVGAREEGARWVVDVLVDHLRERRVLLVLDNFEQVLDAATDVAALLEACPRLTLIVTSRAPLRLTGEQEVPVLPLALPDPEGLTAVGELLGVEAVALFAKRASSVDPTFRITEDVARVVAEICVRLEGLPLAIELAASRLRTLPPEALLARLDRRLPLLTGGARNAPERQRTLRSTIAWSEELLEAPTRTFFARLAVLRGDWTLEAADAVANPSSELGVETLEALEALRDHALIRPRAGDHGGPWFSMLETIREYAAERLAASGEESVVRRRHAAYFLALAEAAEPQLTGARAVEWRTRLDREYPNVRAAVEWSISTQDAETALRIVAALWRFWQVRGVLREAARLLDAALALPGAAPRTPLRARALIAAGSISYWAGDQEATRRRYEEALAISRELEDDVGIAHGLYNLAFSYGIAGEFDVSLTMLDEARQRFEGLGDPLMTAHTKIGLAMALMRSGEPATAADLAADALRAFEELDQLQWISLATGVLAQIAFVRGDEERTLRYTREAIDATRRLADPLGTAVQLRVVAAILARRGLHERALRFAGAAERISDEAGGEAPRALIEAEDPLVVAAQTLSEEQIRALREEGRHLATEDAVRLAGRELEDLLRA